MCKMQLLRERLYQLHTESGKSVADFAEFLGTSRQSLGYYLNGERTPGPRMMKQICERCNVSSDWLSGLSGVRSPDTNIQAISQYTGLSEKAIYYLSENHSNSANLNTFLESENGRKIIDDTITFLCSDFSVIWNLPRKNAAANKVAVEGFSGTLTLEKEELENAYIVRIINEIRSWKDKFNAKEG